MSYLLIVLMLITTQANEDVIETEVINIIDLPKFKRFSAL